MCKKLGKFLLFSIAAGAAAYGAYYYLKKEKVLTPIVDEDDDTAFDEDLDGEPTKARSYINLTFDKQRAEELAKSAVDKAKTTITDSVHKVEEFFNDESTTIVDEVKDTVEDAAEEAAQAADDIADAASEITE